MAPEEPAKQIYRFSAKICRSLPIYRGCLAQSAEGKALNLKIEGSNLVVHIRRLLGRSVLEDLGC